MVENVSLRSNVAGTQGAGDIKGLEHTDALKKLSSGIDNLEKHYGAKEKQLSTLEAQLSSEKGLVSHYDNKVKNANWWDKLVNNDDSWTKSKKTHAGKVSSLETQIASLKKEMGTIAKDADNLRAAVKAVETASANELAEKTKALQEALKSGDLSGAIMLVLGDKAKGLKGQVDRKMAEIDARNKESVKIDEKIAKLDPKNEKEAKQIKELEAEQNDLNAMNQTDMIRMQTTLNRYNQTNEMMSNLIQKLSRAMDGIISNMK